MQQLNRKVQGMFRRIIETELGEEHIDVGTQLHSSVTPIYGNDPLLAADTFDGRVRSIYDGEERRQFRIAVRLRYSAQSPPAPP